MAAALEVWTMSKKLTLSWHVDVSCFESLSNQSGQVITYSLKRGNLFILGGTQGSWMFYQRVEQRGSDTRGYRLNWPAYRADEDQHLVFDDAIGAGASWRREQLEFLDGYYGSTKEA